MVELMATLYQGIMRYDPKNPTDPERDRFILSKGHGALGLYSALLVSGVISEDVYNSFQTNESLLTTHPVQELSLGIESSNGSLGQGLSMAVGLALSAKRKQKSHRVYVYLGDGECNEGAVWEAAMSAASYKLNNLIAVVDNNGFQNDGASASILEIGDLADKWRSFGWHSIKVDGHDIKQIHDAFVTDHEAGKPKVLVAKTVKGKGVSFMENDNSWHHNLLTRALYEKVMLEWEGAPSC